MYVNKTLIQNQINQKIEDHKRKAQELKNEYKYDKAIIEYKKVLLQKKIIMMIPFKAWPYQDLAEIFKTIGDTNYSIQLLQKACLLDKENENIKQDINSQAIKQGYMLLQAQDKLISKPKNQDEEEILAMEKPQFILYTNALVMRDQGYYQYSLQDINKCLHNNPKEFQAIILKINLLMLFGRFEECNFIMIGAHVAQQAYQINKKHHKVLKIMQFFKPKSDEYLQKAKQLILKQEFANSLYFIQKGLLFDPQSLQLMLLKAFINRSQKNYEQSLVDLEQAYKICSNQQEIENVREQIAHTYNEMAKLLFSLGRAQEALQIFSEALNFKSNDWGILVNRSDCYSMLKDYEKAGNDLALAKSQPGADVPQIDSRNSIVMTLKGIEIFNLQKYDKAIKFFTEAIVCDSFKNAGAYAKRGICFIKKGKVIEAQQDFKKALQINPQNADALGYFNNTNFKPK